MNDRANNVLKKVSNEFAIRNLFKLMFYRGECLYLRITGEKTKKEMGFLVDASKKNFSIKVADNFEIPYGAKVVITSNYKNIP